MLGRVGIGGATLRRLFNAYGSLVTSTDLVWSNGEFDTLTRLFDRVGIRKNIRKMVGLIFCPF